MGLEGAALRSCSPLGLLQRSKGAERREVPRERLWVGGERGAAVIPLALNKAVRHVKGSGLNRGTKACRPLAAGCLSAHPSVFVAAGPGAG